jgi:hypothetical protein
MYTLIEYPIGVIVEAVVLSTGLNRMRVAVAGLPDALELTESGHGWVTEEGREIAIGFLQYDACEAAAVFPHEPVLALRAAGSFMTQSFTAH